MLGPGWLCNLQFQKSRFCMGNFFFLKSWFLSFVW